MKKGKLILIEGTDSSGKNKQTKMLVDRLNINGFQTESMSFPAYDRTPFGRIIGQCYLGKEDLGEKLGWQGDYKWFGEDNDKTDPRLMAMIYAADRATMRPVIMQTLESGKNLVLDRYTESNVAHQGAKIGIDNPEFQKFEEFVYQLEYKTLDLPIPDLFFLLNMPWNVALNLREKRAGVADLIECDIKNLKKTEEAYLCIANQWNWEIINCAPERTIESLRSIEEIHEEIYNITRKKIDPKLD
ncbi:MAG: hypothetical protein WAU65_03185 [Candidatus Nanoarchaeia archaeon]